MAKLKDEKKAKEEEAAAKQIKLNNKVKTVGNYVHADVHVSKNEDDNTIIKTWAPEDGAKAEFKKDGIPHHGVLARLNGYDSERGVKVVGHRGYCLTGYGLFLNMALINYGLEFLFNKGYTPNQPPFFMLRDQMAKTAQLSDFDEELYKVTENKDNPKTDKYLVGCFLLTVAVFILIYI
jgi:seryl-tRNA synthetase